MCRVHNFVFCDIVQKVGDFGVSDLVYILVMDSLIDENDLPVIFVLT
jgi:hypothetical protein